MFLSITTNCLHIPDGINYDSGIAKLVSLLTSGMGLVHKAWMVGHLDEQEPFCVSITVHPPRVNKESKIYSSIPYLTL